jgi:hypothetical protein
MKAKFNGSRANGKNHDDTKERIDTLTLVGANPQSGELERVIDARFWAGRSTTARNVYCSLWITVAGLGTSGYGVSSDPQHKTASARARALNSAGIEYSQDDTPVDLSQASPEEMRASLSAVADALGYHKYIVF